jgi:hypothetical protein
MLPEVVIPRADFGVHGVQALALATFPLIHQGQAVPVVVLVYSWMPAFAIETVFSGDVLNSAFAALPY